MMWDFLEESDYDEEIKRKLKKLPPKLRVCRKDRVKKKKRKEDDKSKILKKEKLLREIFSY